LERWLAVETALDNWQIAWQIALQNALQNAVETSNINSTAEKLVSSLEQFNEELENFTASLVFHQYERIGLLSLSE